jgi:Type VI secretion system/phage-baseplate injector OB domain
MRRLSDVMPPPADDEGARAYLGLYKGQVTNNNDDTKRARLKLIIPQVTGEAEHPSWAEPVGLAMTPGRGYGSLDLPQKNDWVWVEFEAGNPAYPRWRPGWWADDELPEPFRANYPDVRGFKTKAGHVFFVDDKDGKLHFEHADGHVVELSKEGVRVRGKDKDIGVDAGSGKVTVRSSSKIVIDAPAIEIVSGASHPMLLSDTFLQDFAQAWTQLLSGLAAGTQGGPTAQVLTGLQSVMATLQQFGSKLSSGQTYESTKAKVS